MISLPWPPAATSPNSRGHWRKRHAAAKQYRSTAYFATLLSNVPRPLPFDGDRLPMRITFYPPDKRHRDDDNMIGSFKSARDGIADAIAVNDRCFAPHYVFEQPTKGGIITVEIGQ